jgi:hypothetical protein
MFDFGLAYTHVCTCSLGKWSLRSTPWTSTHTCSRRCKHSPSRCPLSTAEPGSGPCWSRSLLPPSTASPTISHGPGHCAPPDVSSDLASNIMLASLHASGTCLLLLHTPLKHPLYDRCQARTPNTPIPLSPGPWGTQAVLGTQALL